VAILTYGAVPVQNEISGDLDEIGEAEVGIGRLLRSVDQENLYEALDHPTSFQSRELIHVISYIYTLAHCNREKRRGLVRKPHRGMRTFDARPFIQDRRARSIGRRRERARRRVSVSPASISLIVAAHRRRGTGNGERRETTRSILTGVAKNTRQLPSGQIAGETRDRRVSRALFARDEATRVVNAHARFPNDVSLRRSPAVNERCRCSAFSEREHVGDRVKSNS